VNKIVAKTGKAPPEEKPCIIINIPDAVQADTVDGYFRIISKCMTEHCSLDITYRARHRRKSTRRTVDPYGLVFHRGAWMLVAFCHLRGEIRTFALDRIMDVKERTMPFQPLEGFDLEEFLSQSWGIYRSKEVRLKVRFSAEIADYILRRPKWHPSEKRKILADGSVELSFRIMGIEEMKGWIYSWIPNVEVIRPQWLRAQIAEELGGTAIRHE
jgi:proteasome accessory factor B